MPDLFSATKGHQFTHRKPQAELDRYGMPRAKFRKWESTCSCGFKNSRQKVAKINPATATITMVLEDLEVFRGRNTAHLYAVWQRSRQGRLEV